MVGREDRGKETSGGGNQRAGGWFCMQESRHIDEFRRRCPGHESYHPSQWNGTTCGAVLQDSAGLSESALMIDLTLNLEKSRAS